MRHLHYLNIDTNIKEIVALKMPSEEHELAWGVVVDEMGEEGLGEIGVEGAVEEVEGADEKTD